MRSSVLAVLEKIANENEKRIAIKSPAGQLTYGQLWRQSDSLAVWINKKLENDGKPVMVFGHKNPQMIMCFLACAKAGRAYCPVDISMPKSRIEDIAKNIDNSIILATEDLELEGFEVIDKEMIKKVSETEQTEKMHLEGVSGEDVFYIIFTSGSTGNPKGVQISSDNLMNFANWSSKIVKERLGFKDGEHITFLNQAPFSFDLSVMDLYTSLFTGGKLVCLDKKLQSDAKLMFDYMEQAHINCWVSTPSFAEMCLADKIFCQENFEELKLFMFCGERFTVETAKRLAERFPKAQIINTYGPTESTVAVTAACITPEIMNESDLLPIGVPKDGTRLEIRDEEIIIIGDTVGKGYYKNPQKTDQAFFTVEDTNGNKERAYRTGDKGFFRDGNYYCTGRIDNQVKLHGYRIELGDIEANLMLCNNVEQAVVLPKYENEKIKSLAAFVKAPGLEGSFKDAKYLKGLLKEKLPAYMVPKNIKFVKDMPMTANGKLDRNKLKEGLV